MRRMAVALGMLGLICAAALPASAQKTIKIFGQNYNVVAQRRTQTYKNGVTIHEDDRQGDVVNGYAGVYFSEGGSMNPIRRCERTPDPPVASGA